MNLGTADVLPNSKKVILFVAVRAFAVSNSRLVLIRQLIENGWRIICIAAPDGSEKILKDAGADFDPLPIKRGGLSLVNDFQTLWVLIRLYARYQPDLIQHFHGKPIILGTLASYFSPRSKVVNAVTGLGFPFLKKNFSFKLFLFLFRLLQRRSRMEIFQNPDDLAIFLDRKWTHHNRSALILSSGVDIQKFSPGSKSARAQEPFIFMAARLVWMKGVREFCEAAREVKNRFPRARFVLAGAFDQVHPDAIPRTWIEEQVRANIIEYVGFQENIAPWLHQAWIAVLPSYREGTPRFLLEAAACGLPVVTTDAPGCRETVVQNTTGKLIPLQDARALSREILSLLENPAQMQQLGEAGRKRVEKDFDIRIIAGKYFNLYTLLAA